MTPSGGSAMRTIKILGSGDLAGFAGYATVAHMDIVFDHGVVLEMDEEAEFHGRAFRRATLSIHSGAMLVWRNGHVETDLLHVDPRDLPRLQEAHANWYGR
jgi:hypothetical protein